ncbi:hypothetical protein [Chitinophaga agri]|uniref:Uncharacterized protein n=1 Tax=Chitinophaga agri TaxID=2703787 RepID=A0A6B9ZNM2_9BACT|nr:hypothetical protein [Chitinophaga agri]QHS62233.1 hypothetical protein GWR21_22280 [Chitinophaga agri]
MFCCIRVGGDDVFRLLDDLINDKSGDDAVFRENIYTAVQPGHINEKRVNQKVETFLA